MMLGNDIYNEAMLDDSYILLTTDGFKQGSFHLFPGHILVMDDPEL